MNKKQVVYDIIRESGPVSRIDLHRNYGLRKATVTRLTEKLLEENLICFSGKDCISRGRAPELLSINDSAFHVIGIHAAGSFLNGGIVSSGGNLCYYSRVPFPSRLSAGTFLNLAAALIKDLSDEAVKRELKISSVGMALPGEVDHENGILNQAAVILPGLKAVPCKEFLENESGMSVTVDHDVAMMAYGEFLWGSAKRVSNMGTLFVGDGIGGRFIINGELFRGARNRAGEVGHIPLRRQGPLCKCGMRGCLEALASIPAIEAAYGGNTSFDEILENANAGENKALDVLRKAGTYLGEALAVIFDITDIDMIVISGDIIKAEEVMKSSLVNSLTRNAHSKQPANKEFILFSRFGAEAGIIGAAACASREIFKNSGIDI